MLEAELTATGDEPETKLLALNDVVVARGEIARIIYVEASVSGEPLTTYKADGVIVATATGSTGYSLAAGGPILHPQADEMLLVPILPHLSLNHTLVLPPAAVVKLRLSTTHKATLSIDGHISLPLASGATITVKHSPGKTRFLRLRPRASFYSSLEQKLRG
jgi:NAD+ kinase